MENTFLQEILPQHKASNKNIKSLLFGTLPSKMVHLNKIYIQASEMLTYSSLFLTVMKFTKSGNTFLFNLIK